MTAGSLAQVLGKIPKLKNPNIIVGYDTFDDAGIYRLDDEHALVQTIDFFTPVVDDPYTFGAIAAANSLSDIYAMGGTPLTALAIACFPEASGEMDILARIMTGGAEKLIEAGVPVLGGHTVNDSEIKFGYAITGIIHPARIMTNAGAKPGDVLILTKPLGIGIVTSGIKFGKSSPQAAAQATEAMLTLNRKAAEIMMRHSCHAATDITGNGLLGHAYEMATASRVSIHFSACAIPYIREAYPLAESGILPGTIASTWEMIENKTFLSPSVPEALRNILLDPQTSGGLLIAVADSDSPALASDLINQGIHAVKIGQVGTETEKNIYVEWSDIRDLSLPIS